MTRVATIPLQHIMSAGIMHAQELLQSSQTQLATGKKAADYAALGADGIRSISAHSLAAQQSAYGDVATKVGSTMTLYDTHISSIETAASDLRTRLLAALGTGQTTTVADDASSAFDQVRASLNASADGVPLFGGAQTAGDPLQPTSFAATAGLTAATTFANDNVKSVARVGDGVNIQYGITASDLGTSLLGAFTTLANAGPIGATPTAAQVTAINATIAQLDAGLTQVRAAAASNGRNQVQADTAATRATDRGTLLVGIISTNEDADLGQIAIDIAQNKTVLQASYSVFSQLAGLNLGAYLK